MQTWALEHNIDLSLPGNANLIAQLLPVLQSRMAAMQKTNESTGAIHSSRLHLSKQQIMSSTPAANDSSVQGNSSSDVSGQAASGKTRHPLPSSMSFPTAGTATIANSNNIQMQQLTVQGRENQSERVSRHPITHGNGMVAVNSPQSSGSPSPSVDHSHGKSTFNIPETLQMQYFKQLQHLNRPSSQSTVSSSDGSGSHFPSQGATATPMPQQHFGFTKQQLHVLKAQILAFRRLKSWEKTMDYHSPGQGLMPASFKVRSVPLDGDDSTTKDVLDPDFGESTIGRVTPVDSRIGLLELCTREFDLGDI